ncbi:hypothetical protein V8E36_005106, partial [Tilletia maclaganii]
RSARQKLTFPRYSAIFVAVTLIAADAAAAFFGALTLFLAFLLRSSAFALHSATSPGTLLITQALDRPASDSVDICGAGPYGPVGALWLQQALRRRGMTMGLPEAKLATLSQTILLDLTALLFSLDSGVALDVARREVEKGAVYGSIVFPLTVSAVAEFLDPIVRPINDELQALKARHAAEQSQMRVKQIGQLSELQSAVQEAGEQSDTDIRTRDALLDRAEAEIQALRQDNERLKKSVAALEEKEETEKLLTNHLHQQSRRAEETASSLRNSLAGMEAALSQLRRDQIDTISHLQQTVTQQQTTIPRLRDALEDKHRDQALISEQKASIVDKEREISELRETIAQLKDNRRERDVEKQKRSISQKDDEIFKLRTTIAQLQHNKQKDVEQHNARIADNEREISDLRATISQLESDKQRDVEQHKATFWSKDCSFSSGWIFPASPGAAHCLRASTGHDFPTNRTRAACQTAAGRGQ